VLGVVLLLVLGVVLPVVIVVVLSVTLMVTLWLVDLRHIHEILAPRGHGDQPSAAQPSAARHSSVGDGHGAELASRQLIPCRRTHSSAQPLLNEQERHRHAHLQARLLVAETLAL